MTELFVFSAVTFHSEFLTCYHNNMIYPAIFCESPFPRALPRYPKPPQKPSSLTYSKPIRCFQHPHNPNAINKPTIFINPSPVNVKKKKKQKMMVYEREERGFLQVVGSRQMLLLCGFGYWVQGFRCFPWLALNFHMANNLSLHPSILQLVQNSGNLPMVAKPLYGILSDAIYIGGAHRIPYIVIGGKLTFPYTLSFIFFSMVIISKLINFFLEKKIASVLRQ